MNPDEIRATLADRFARVEGRITAACARAGRGRSDVTLVAVTKTVSAEVAAVARELGYAEFGEGRPQELWAKAAAIPGVRWHLVGHLQRNKLDRTLPLGALIHSGDRVSLLEGIEAEARKRNLMPRVLLQFNVSREGQKHGFAPEAWADLVPVLDGLTHTKLAGVMGMASYELDAEACRPAFAELRELAGKLRAATGLALPVLSMGMSNDFEVAVEEGSTHVRVGTTLFEGL